MVEIFIAYAVLGAFAGIMAGLLGVGGGLIIVPVLVFLWQPEFSGGEQLGGSQTVQLAIGTSLAVIVFTSLSSVRAHHLRKSVLWPVVWKLTPGILVGAWLGAALASVMPQNMLKITFGLFELLVAAQMSFSLRRASQAPHQELSGTLVSGIGMGLAGIVIGAVSALVGIGGGTLTVPFLNACKVRMQQAIGTSAACGLPIAVGGALSYLILGWNHEALPVASMGYVYGPALLGIAVTSVLFAPLGANLAHRLPTSTLKKVFAGFLALLGLWMLASF